MSSELYELYCPCHFGLEAVLKREIIDLGYDVKEVADGHVTFLGDAEAIALANIWLRTTERVMIVVGRFHATTNDEYFDGISALPLEKLIPEDAHFWIKKATSIKSRLFGTKLLQSMGKKAMVKRLSKAYHKDPSEMFEEIGADYPLRVFLMKDEVTVLLDTSGESLHKRGYRTSAGEAPISETLAAALVLLSPWKRDRILVDPFCGSGTILIEAAMIARNLAPGKNRTFTAEAWPHLVPKEIWEDCREEAEEAVSMEAPSDIQGYDIDREVLKTARENADRAGVGADIHFQQRDVKDLSHPKKYGFLITNPPYGERLMEKETIGALYRTLGERFGALDSWSLFLITSYEQAENGIGRRADKNRKIYNGMIEARLYQFLGPKPPAKKKTE